VLEWLEMVLEWCWSGLECLGIALEGLEGVGVVSEQLGTC